MKRWAYPAATFNQTPNTVAVDLGSQSARDNLRGQKGKNPDRRLRSLSSAKLLRKLDYGDSQDVGLEAATI